MHCIGNNTVIMLRNINYTWKIERNFITVFELFEHNSQKNSLIFFKRSFEILKILHYFNKTESKNKF